jgi:MraZ protein
MNCDSDGRAFYIVPGQRAGTLAVYPERYFERTRAHIPSPEQLSDGGHEWRQFEYSQSALLDPDNQGRILIPERLLKRAGIGREVTLIGVRDRLELWSRAEFDAFQDGKWPDYPQRRAEAMQELRELQTANAAAERSVRASQD